MAAITMADGTKIFYSDQGRRTALGRDGVTGSSPTRWTPREALDWLYGSEDCWGRRTMGLDRPGVALGDTSCSYLKRKPQKAHGTKQVIQGTMAIRQRISSPTSIAPNMAGGTIMKGAADFRPLLNSLRVHSSNAATSAEGASKQAHPISASLGVGPPRSDTKASMPAKPNFSPIGK
jgi:hypothetical protein